MPMTDERELRPATRDRVRLRSEPQPDPEVLARIEGVEDAGIRLFWVIESEEQFRVRFRNWRDNHHRRVEYMPETDDMVEMEDRSACDLQGMDLLTYGEFLLAMLPGFVQGYSHGGMPGTPTNAKPGSDEKSKSIENGSARSKRSITRAIRGTPRPQRHTRRTTNERNQHGLDAAK